MRQMPDPAVLEWIDDQPQHRLYISAVTRAEIELGVALLPEGRRKHGLRTAALRMFAEFHGRCLTFDEPAASRYAALVSTRMRAGRPISVEDAQIAAMALAGGFLSWHAERSRLRRNRWSVGGRSVHALRRAQSQSVVQATTFSIGRNDTYEMFALSRACSTVMLSRLPSPRAAPRTRPPRSPAGTSSRSACRRWGSSFLESWRSPAAVWLYGA